MAVRRVSSRRTGSVHSVEILFAGKKARQYFLIRNTLPAVLSPQVLQGISRMRPLGDFLRARAAENFFFNVSVHERRAFFAPDTHGVFNCLIRHLLVTFTDNDIDRRLAADELRNRSYNDRA